MATIDEEAPAGALEGLPGWQRRGDNLWKTYQFDDFATAALFVGRVADATAGAGHQPDIAIRGGRVTLELVPRAGTALTADDLTVAHRIQQLVGAGQPLNTLLASLGVCVFTGFMATR